MCTIYLITHGIVQMSYLVGELDASPALLAVVLTAVDLVEVSCKLGISGRLWLVNGLGRAHGVGCCGAPLALLDLCDFCRLLF